MDGVDGQLNDVAGILIPGRFRRTRRRGKNQRRPVSRAKTKFPISVFASGCRWRRSSSPEMFAASPRPTAREFDQESADPVICLLDEQREVENKGGSMRLGTWPTKIVEGTRRGKNLWRRRSARAASAPLRVQHEVSRADGRKRVPHQRNFTRRRARGINRVA